MTDERLTLRQAALRLGVSESAIRKRVERGTLPSDKGPDGRRYVYLDVAELGADTVTDEGADTSATSERDALTSELRDRLRYVEGQLEAERQAHAEARRLLLKALDRIPPQLEAPQEPSESPPSPGPTQTPTDVGGGPETPTEQRSWWSRMFGS